MACPALRYRYSGLLAWVLRPTVQSLLRLISIPRLQGNDMFDMQDRRLSARLL